MKKFWFLALLGALLVVGAACGGGDDEGGDSDAGSKAGAETESPSGDGGSTASGELAVKAVDFAFQPESSTVEAGETTFTFTNEGKEQHELAMVGLKEGAPDLQELVQLPEKEAEKYFASAPFGTQGPIKPGETTEFTEELQPGIYAMVCFVEKDGKPHVALGMVNQLTVK